MNQDFIIVKGAKQHNLKNIDVKIPRDSLTVITGLSGSGKSSLAFDTLYAEGQRRYVESLSSYARQFLGQMEKPEVDSIVGLSPAISIDQKTTGRNPRSTVGTVTEIYDYLRLLYARVGHPHCPTCGNAISAQSIDQMIDRIMTLEMGTKILILAPVVRGRKGEFYKILEKAKKSGYARVSVDGSIYNLNEEFEDIKLEKNKKHYIEIVVDRLVIKEGIESRLFDSIETVLNLTDGILYTQIVDGELLKFSQNLSCPECGFSMEELSPRLFSFNAPFGACPHCLGLGTIQKIDPDLIIPDKNLSLLEGAISISGWNSLNEKSYTRNILDALAEKYNFDLDVPFKDLPDDIQDIILYGTKGEKILVEYTQDFGVGKFNHSYEGIVNNVERRYKDTSSEMMKQYYEGFMSVSDCEHCKGRRLKDEVLAVTVGEKNIQEVCELPIHEFRDYFRKIELTEREQLIAEKILKELEVRSTFLIDVGLDYLTLSRKAATLSGGESQRIRLATQIGSGLVGVVYILDEPSIGLHQKDNRKLIETLKKLRDMGNTLIVVEHDEETMLESDYIIDMGPKAGVHGGDVVAYGTPSEIMKHKKSITGAYLSGKKKIVVPEVRRSGNGNVINIIGAAENNLKNINVDIPLGELVCITGVSGSGKSSLINQVLLRELKKVVNRSRVKSAKVKEIKGLENIDKAIVIDQTPIGRTPRSNPATYTGLFDIIREIFASTNDAKARGYKAGRFSFNVKGGRCESCKGDGINRIEMHFLPDIYVTCDVCKGNRYNRETLEVKYKGKSIADVLNMTVEEACEFFKNIPKAARKLEILNDVGLGYIRLGQPSTTLSGGEAQRIKLATELSKRSTGKTLYLLDEPTTGLHVHDVKKLISILQRLVNGGNSVLVIEHNMDVIKSADYIIDLGPQGGDNGGTIVATGTPEEIAGNKYSFTGQILNKLLK